MNTAIIDGKSIHAQEWDDFIQISPQGNIYHEHAYLSHLLPDWSAVIVRDGGSIIAVFPYAINRKWGVLYALQPYFAQYLGILFGPPAEKVYKNLEFQKKAIAQIQEALPQEIAYLSYNFAPEFTYELPLKWLGWQQSMLYTYWVDIREGYAAFLQSAASHVRREVKKAEQANIRIEVENNPELVVSILKQAKAKAVEQIPEHFFSALCLNARYYHALDRSCCLIAYDGEQPVAAIIYFFYKNKMIYYQGSTLPSHKNAGVMSKIIVESVRLFGEQYDYLDFDGSMLEPIERFFRGFGAFPVRYSNFTLNRLPRFHKMVLAIKRVLG